MYKCKKCFKQYKFENSLKKHLKSEHQQQKETCNFCHKKFTRVYGLNQHILNVHKHQRSVTCIYCHQTFNNTRQLERHVWTHAEKEKYSCPFCQQGFSTKCNHILLKHGSNDDFIVNNFKLQSSLDNKYLANH